MTVTIFKYRINELLNAMPVKEYKKAIHIIPKQLDISEKTFANYRNIKIHDLQDIPHEKVVLLEKLFDIKPGELDNFILIVNPITTISNGASVEPAKMSIKINDGY